MVEWTVFAIRPSSYISTYCYSIFRLEPFAECGFACAYCYARWYRWRAPRPRPQWWALRLWEKLARRLERVWPKPFFRLATLSDPLQWAEKESAISLQMLRVASRHGVPVVVNTKSPLVAQPPWLDVLASLANRGLVLVQLTIAFSDHTREKLEPLAPSTEARLEALHTLASHGIPVVVRVQPLIPGLEEEQLGIARRALEEGALGLIGESIRETPRGFQLLTRLLGYDVAAAAGGLEQYQRGPEPGREGLLHPRAEWRRRIHGALERLAVGYGRPYAVCKEGFQSESWGLGRDCCLTWLAMKGRALRPTVFELNALGVESPGDYQEKCLRELAPRDYLCGPLLDQLPSPLRKALRVHEEKLLKTTLQHLKRSRGDERETGIAANGSWRTP